MKNLIPQKLHLITGKGGVGKSFFSLALAYKLRQIQTQKELKPILLAELNETSYFEKILPTTALQFKPTNWEGIDFSLWTAQECLKEYALSLIKVPSLAELFLNNPVSKSLIDIAPGLKELSLLGKATSYYRQHGPPLLYENIILDCYSSGHFMSLLRAPRGLKESVSFGPMHEQSKSIELSLQDSNYCHIYIVTLTEELPLQESIELYKQIKTEFGIEAQLILNKTIHYDENTLEQAPPALQNYLRSQISNQKNAHMILKNENITALEIPFVPSLNIQVCLKKVLPFLEKLII